MHKPLVSIALCTYNGEKYLQEQLDSLVQQTYRNLEIICVDDNSRDKTYEILQRYSLRYPHFKIFRNENNLGYVKNFEKAITLCQGEFISLSDQDDIWHPEKIELLVKHIGDNQLIYHDSEFISEDGTSMQRKLSDVCNFYRGSDPRAFLLGNCVSGHAVLFRKTLVSHVVPFPTKIYHDWWLAYIACNYGSIDYLDQRLVKYRQHASASTNILKQKRSQPKERSEKKVEKEIERAHLFAKKAKKHQAYINHFSHLVYSRKSSILSVSLLLFLFRNQSLLMSLQRKTFLSRWGACLRFSWGKKMYLINSK